MTVPFDCPRCGTVLTMSDRAGIEIDYCPSCRGVWLDRGELDKIIARAETAPDAPAAPNSAWTAPNASGWRPEGGHRGEHGGHGKQAQHGRRKSWLQEMFD
jgi:Zn-finger nucleic acid-binding protein